jgi:hypothetical protein
MFDASDSLANLPQPVGFFLTIEGFHLWFLWQVVQLPQYSWGSSRRMRELFPA